MHVMPETVEFHRKYRNAEQIIVSGKLPKYILWQIRFEGFRKGAKHDA